MARLILHIGMPKAGSTAIQQFLVDNRDRLAAAGLTYSDALRGPNHSQLAVAFSTRPTRLAEAFAVDSDADRDALRDRLSRRLSRAVEPDQTWIASSEHLSSLLRRAEIQALASFLGGLFDEVVPIAVVRRGDYWLPSAYVEAVKAGRAGPMNPRFVRRRAHLLDHRSFVGRWEAGFGPGALRLVPYLEADKADSVALPLRLLAAAGVSVETHSDWQVERDMANPSLSGQATELLRLLNPRLPAVGLRPTTERHRLVDYAATHWPGPSTRLTPAAARALRRAGWIRTGVAGGAGQRTTDWVRWARQPMAAVGRAPRVDPQRVDAAYDELRRAGLVRSADPDSRAARLAASLRRGVIRVVRR